MPEDQAAPVEPERPFEPAGPGGPAGRWTVESIGGRPVERTTPAASAPTLAFTTGIGGQGTVEGHGGVNQFAGPCRVEGAMVALGPFRSTRMAGPVAAMKAEHALLEALEGTKPFRLAADGEVLIVGEADAAVRLRRRAPETG